jgi:hypothetical protein
MQHHSSGHVGMQPNLPPHQLAYPGHDIAHLSHPNFMAQSWPPHHSNMLSRQLAPSEMLPPNFLLNNPKMYTDPSGQRFVWDAANSRWQPIVWDQAHFMWRPTGNAIVTISNRIIFY